MPLIFPTVFFGGQRLASAIRLNGTDEALTRTANANTTDRTQFTWNVWVRRDQTGRNDYIHTTDNGTHGARLFINSSDRLVLFGSDAATPGNTHCNVLSSVTIAADVWINIHVEYDTALAASNRVRFWFDGVEDTSKTVSVAPTGTLSQWSLNTTVNSIGRDLNAGGFFFGDLALFHHVDGSVVGVTTFADTIGGTFQAVEALGITYQGNGWFLDFVNASDLGNDPDNSNDHTLVNVDATNAIGDGPPTSY